MSNYRFLSGSQTTKPLQHFVPPLRTKFFLWMPLRTCEKPNSKAEKKKKKSKSSNRIEKEGNRVKPHKILSIVI